MTRRLVNPNTLITLGFLLLAVMVVIQAGRWPFRSALFPLLAAWMLLIFSALKLTLDVVAVLRPAPPSPPPAPAIGRAPGDEGDDEVEEDAFQTASRAEWLAATGWMAAFFTAFWLLGALVGIPLFAFVYLLVASRESPLLAGIYAFVCWGFVYGLFDRGLHVPLPEGVLRVALGF